MPETFGQWLQRRRRGANLNQAELASLARVTRSTISLYEKDEIQQPRRKQVEKIAKALNAPVEEAWQAASGLGGGDSKDALVAFLNSTELTDAEREELAKSIRRQIAGMKAERDAEGVE